MTSGNLTKKIIGFIRSWALPSAIVTGILLYVIYDNIPGLAPAGPYLEKTVDILQPLLIFSMLFLSVFTDNVENLRSMDDETFRPEHSGLFFKAVPSCPEKPRERLM